MTVIDGIEYSTNRRICSKCWYRFMREQKIPGVSYGGDRAEKLRRTDCCVCSRPLVRGWRGWIMAGGEPAALALIAELQSKLEIDVSDIPGAQLCGSPIEVRFFAEAQRQGLYLVPQFETDGYKLDFAIPGLLCAIELDGHDSHKTREQRTHDADRQLLLERFGWRVFRFTGTQIHDDVVWCVDQAIKLIDPIHRAKLRG